MRSVKVMIDKRRCQGCNYCVQFCPSGCLEKDAQSLNERGLSIPAPVKPEKCSGCGTCVQMCPHWAIQVIRSSEPDKEIVIGAPKLAQDPPLAGCTGCQHPTIGRILAEAIDELGCQNKIRAFESIPCSTSSVFGSDIGTKMALDESVFDAACIAKRNSPDSVVLAIQGYWGQADFSFNTGRLINSLIRGDKISVIFVNTPYFSSRDQRPIPANEPIEGQLEPLTQVQTPEGTVLVRGGYPWHVAEMAKTFEGVSYIARGSIASVMDYNLTKGYIRKALQKQIDGSGLGLVEILNTCSDQAYIAPTEGLKWVKEKMVKKFPLGELKNI